MRREKELLVYLYGGKEMIGYANEKNLLYSLREEKALIRL